MCEEQKSDLEQTYKFLNQYSYIMAGAFLLLIIGSAILLVNSISEDKTLYLLLSIFLFGITYYLGKKINKMVYILSLFNKELEEEGISK